MAMIVSAGTINSGTIVAYAQDEEKESPPPFTKTDLAASEKLFDLEFTEQERELLFEDLVEQFEALQTLHGLTVKNSVPPALVFNPLPSGFAPETKEQPIRLSTAQALAVPDNASAEDLDKLAYASVGDLSELIRTRKITSLQLTQMYLARLKKHGPTLESVVTLTEDLALQQARQADKEIATGNYRGPLHGHPVRRQGSVVSARVQDDLGSSAVSRPGARRYGNSCAQVARSGRRAGGQDNLGRVGLG